MNLEAFHLPEQEPREIIEAAAERSPEQARVLAEVDRLDVGLDLRRHPAILERLADTGEHFHDSVVMARIIEVIYGDLRATLNLSETDPKQMMRAAVLHDIGKSGPAGEKGPVQAAVRRLFVPPTRPFRLMDGNRPKTIHDFVTELEYPDATSIEADLTEAGFNVNEEPIIEFWRRHAQWSYDILKDAPSELVDERTLNIAASHHLFENKNPARLDLDHVPAEAHVLEVIEKSEMLAAVDKYQAYRERLKMDHRTSMEWLAKFYSANPPDLPTKTRESFIAVIAVLDRNQAALERLMDTSGV